MERFIIPGMETQAFYSVRQEKTVMGKLKSHMSSLMTEKGWSDRDFIAECIRAGLSQDTAKKFLAGETNFQADTILTVANIFGRSSIGDVIDKNNGNH